MATPNDMAFPNPTTGAEGLTKRQWMVTRLMAGLLPRFPRQPAWKVLRLAEEMAEEILAQKHDNNNESTHTGN